MTSPDVPNATPLTLRAVVPLLVVGGLLSPLLVLTQVVAEGVVKDVVSLVLVLAIIATLIVPVLLLRRTTGGNDGEA